MNDTAASGISLTDWGTWWLCRTVGVRLGAGESLHDIMSSSKQVAEGVTTAGGSQLF